MSANNNERRELTAAELDLVVGAAIFMKIDGVKATSVVRLDRGVVRTLRMRMTGQRQRRDGYSKGKRTHDSLL